MRLFKKFRNLYEFKKLIKLFVLLEIVDALSDAIFFSCALSYLTPIFLRSFGKSDRTSSIISLEKKLSNTMCGKVYFLNIYHNYF